MKKVRDIFQLGMLGALLCFVAAYAGAGEITHRGVKADPSGSAQHCLSCHDGALASHAATCTVQCGFSSSHSILKPYPPTAKEREFAPLQSILRKGIKLENQKVTCISCHDIRGSGKYLLVIDNKNSALCRACHVKM